MKYRGTKKEYYENYLQEGCITQITKRILKNAFNQLVGGGYHCPLSPPPPLQAPNHLKFEIFYFSIEKQKMYFLPGPLLNLFINQPNTKTLKIYYQKSRKERGMKHKSLCGIR